MQLAHGQEDIQITEAAETFFHLPRVPAFGLLRVWFSRDAKGLQHLGELLTRGDFALASSLSSSRFRPCAIGVS